MDDANIGEIRQLRHRIKTLKADAEELRTELKQANALLELAELRTKLAEQEKTNDHA